MKIFLDIDDTITYAPEFFSFLTHALAKAEITIITFRDEYDSARQTLEELGIRYDKLIVSSDNELGMKEGDCPSEWKSRVVNASMPEWFFEDMPEVVCRIHEDVKVFMPCDEIIRDWLKEATSSKDRS